MTSAREKRIDVQRSNYNVVDSEFDNMRDRFDAEMRRVEDEMARLRREFETVNPPGGGGAGVANKSITYNNAAPMPPPPQPLAAPPPASYGQPAGSTAIKHYDPYIENIKSPLIRDDSDGKTLRLRFDVAQYRPEEVTVKTVDNRLLVYAKHEEKAPNRSVFREYNQEFLLPYGTNPEYITSTLSVDGVLTVEAPLPAIAGPPGGGYRQQITHQ